MRYEKGRKDASRRRILDIAAARFRRDGIAASGLAGIMTDAGMTNGAFYPHFKSKTDLVRQSVAAALEVQSAQIAQALASGGLEAVVSQYLSMAHRDEPAGGCISASVLPELARQPAETRQHYADQFMSHVRQIAQALPPETPDPEGAVIGIFSTLLGALQMARAVDDVRLAERILAAGRAAALSLARSGCPLGVG